MDIDRVRVSGRLRIEVIIPARARGKCQPSVEHRGFEPKFSVGAVAVMSNEMPLVDPPDRRAQVAIEVLTIVQIPGKRGGPEIRQRAAAGEIRHLLGAERAASNQRGENDKKSPRGGGARRPSGKT